MKVFIDNDVVLDVILGREKYVDTKKLLGLLESKAIDGYTSSIVMVNSLYIARKHIGTTMARKKLRVMLKLLGIVETGQREVDLAFESKFQDFEDAIQYFSAQRARIKMLVTRNVHDYPVGIEVRVLTPAQLLKLTSN